jgi:hypothetical protein
VLAVVVVATPAPLKLTPCTVYVYDLAGDNPPAPVRVADEVDTDDVVTVAPPLVDVPVTK